MAIIEQRLCRRAAKPVRAAGDEDACHAQLLLLLPSLRRQTTRYCAKTTSATGNAGLRKHNVKRTSAETAHPVAEHCDRRGVRSDRIIASGRNTGSWQRSRGGCNVQAHLGT